MKVIVMSKTSFDVTQYTNVRIIAKAGGTLLSITYETDNGSMSATVDTTTANVYIMEV